MGKNHFLQLTEITCCRWQRGKAVFWTTWSKTRSSTQKAWWTCCRVH